MDVTWIDVQPNKNLLDSDFQGYKLSLDRLPCYEAALPSTGLYHVEMPLNQYSLQHVRIHSLQNHLIADPWNQGVVYFMGGNLSLFAVGNSKVAGLAEPVQVYRFDQHQPDDGSLVSTADRYHASLCFCSFNLAIVSDGCGSLFIMETGVREDRQAWKMIFVTKRNPSFVILDACLHAGDELAVSCVTSHVEEKSGTNSFETVITWVHFRLDVSEEWSESWAKTFRTANVEYAALDPTGYLYLASQSHSFSDDHDQNASGDGRFAAGLVSKEAVNKLRYTWIQADDDITIQFSVASGLPKSMVAVTVLPNKLSIHVGGEEVLSGILHQPVSPGECTWTLNNDKLEIFISKAEPKWWTELLVGDKAGEMVADEETAARIHETLDYLTSDKLEEGKEPFKGAAAVNNQELESCDYQMDDSTFLCKFSPNSSRPLHVVNLTGHQWLFNAHISSNESKAFCIRHDVDGLVWQPDSTASHQYIHIATFNALGYVQASKEKRRFITCSPSCSYATIADTEKHVYIYRQPSPLETEVKNRKTGKAVSHIAKQQVISLGTNDAIFGLVASDQALFVLTANHFHMIRV